MSDVTRLLLILTFGPLQVFSIQYVQGLCLTTKSDTFGIDFLCVERHISPDNGSIVEMGLCASL